MYPARSLIDGRFPSSIQVTVNVAPGTIAPGAGDVNFTAARTAGTHPKRCMKCFLTRILCTCQSQARGVKDRFQRVKSAAMEGFGMTLVELSYLARSRKQVIPVLYAIKIQKCTKIETVNIASGINEMSLYTSVLLNIKIEI